MVYIGDLKDAGLARQILANWEKEGIKGEVKSDVNQTQFLLFIEDQQDFRQALDIYRVSMGLAAPPKELPEEWLKIKKLPLGQLTMILLILSIGIYLVARLSGERDGWEWLFISTAKGQALSELRSGQFWRLWTPIFLHFNFLHLLFNMLWLKDLGSLIEYTRGQLFLFFFVLWIGGASNLAQYFVHGPLFGGMSGVVYGFLGYLWMNKHFNQSAEFSLPKSDVRLMVGWFILCMTGLIGSIANTAHGVGLGLGMLWGIIHGVRQSREYPTRKILSFIVLAMIIGFGTMTYEYYF